MGRVVVVLGVEDSDQRVVRGLRHRREQAGILRDLSSRHGGDQPTTP